MKVKPNYYAVIPASVRYDSKLSGSEKIFYAEITALSNDQGYCWASNSYFAKLYDVKAPTVSLWVKSLKDNNHIVVEYEREGKQVKKRKIYPIQKIEIPYSENRKGGSQKIERGWSENRKENTTSNNTTSNNIPFSAFWDLYGKKKERKKCENKWAKFSQSEKEKIMEFVPIYKKSEPDERYRKYPYTFLNSEIWNDDWDAYKKETESTLGMQRYL